MSTATLTVSALVAAACLAPPALAAIDPIPFEVPPLPVGEPELEDAPWPAALVGSADFRDVVVHDVDGDGLPDGLVRNGDSLVVLSGLDVFTAALEMPDLLGGTFGPTLACHDVDVLDDTAGFGGTPGIVSVGPDGLAVIRSVGPAAWAPTLVESSWAFASRVVVGRWSDDTADDVVGLSADGSAVLTHVRLADGDWEAGPSLTPTNPAGELCLVQWDADDALEVAVLEPGFGLEVIDGDDEVLYARGIPYPVGRIVALDDANGEPTALAWLVDVPTPDLSVISVVGPAGTLSTTYLEADAPATLTAGDLDGDGDDDLVVTWADAFEVMVLAQDEGSFDTSAAWSVDTFSPEGPSGVSGNTAPVAIADVSFGGDGTVDLVIPAMIRDAVSIRHGPLLVEELNGSTLKIEPGTSAICENGQGDGYLTFEVAYEPLPLGTTQFELLTWSQDDLTVMADPVTISRCYASTDGGLPTGAGYDLHQVAFQVPRDPAWNGDSDWTQDLRLFHLLVRPIDGAGLPTGHPLLATFTMDPVAMDTIPFEIGWTMHDAHPAVFACDQPAEAGSGGLTGGFVQGKRFPPMPGGQPIITDGCLPAVSD